jgi:hypothetical protein
MAPQVTVMVMIIIIVMVFPIPGIYRLFHMMARYAHTCMPPIGYSDADRCLSSLFYGLISIAMITPSSPIVNTIRVVHLVCTMVAANLGAVDAAIWDGPFYDEI